MCARRIVGVDSSEKIPVGGLRSGDNGLIIRGDAAAMNLSGVDGGGFDVVVAGEFIEHIECPLGFFRNISRDFDDLDLVVSTPNQACFANLLMRLIRREVQHPDHLHNFTFKTLNRMYLRAGLRSWEIIPYRFYAMEIIMASHGPMKLFVKFVQTLTRLVEMVFPLLSFGYIVRARV